MELGLRGKVAVVTGASRGIGFAVARTLLEEGCTLAICARDGERLNAAVKELAHGPHRVIGVPTDVTDEAAVQKFVRRTEEEYCRIDILERQLRDKVFGFFSMIKAVLPIMQHQRDGRIVNIVGQAARHPHPDRFPSGVTNAALLALTKSIADAVARDNIRVNAVCPQYIESALLASLIEKEMRERHVDRATAAAGFTRANPLGRTGKPEEVADLVAFLVSDCANFVAGSSVSIDGGYHRYVFG